MRNSEPSNLESHFIDNDSYSNDIYYLKHCIECPGIVSIEKQELKDIRTYLNVSKEHFAYYKIFGKVDYKDFVKWITINRKKVLIIDDIDNLKYCLENNQTAQVLYTLIRREEYQDGETLFDFSQFTAVILADAKSSNKEGYNFMNYSIRSSIRLII